MECRHHPEVHDDLAVCARCEGIYCASCRVALGGAFYCGVCKAEVVRDLRAGLPEHGLPLASLGRRLLAQLIDQVALTLLTLPVAAGVMALIVAVGPEQLGLLAVPLQLGITAFSLGAALVYEGLLVARRGQTLGKMAIHLRVVSADGAPVSTGRAWARAATKQVFSMLSCLGLVDYIPTLFTPDRTAIHDLVATTRVVEVPR